MNRCIRRIFLIALLISLGVFVYIFSRFGLLLSPKYRSPIAQTVRCERNATRFGMVVWATPNAIDKYKDMLNTKICYSIKHGYSLLLEYNILETQKNIFWNKQRAMEKYMPYFDWLMWSDADTVIMNENVLLEEFIGPDIDLVIDDHNAPISAGVYMLRNSEWSRWFLKMWEEQDALNSVWEDNGAFYHALLKLDPRYNDECSTPDITQSHDNLVKCLQDHLTMYAGPYGNRSLPHVRFMSPFSDKTKGPRGMAFWDRETIWPWELQFQNGDFMVHTKNLERYVDTRQRIRHTHGKTYYYHRTVPPIL